MASSSSRGVLPVKTVNGTVIFVHDGSPPQTNAVHVNGASAVLLTIMKSGASSTLDIINGVKALLPSVSQTLPGSLKLMAAGDQSVFVTDAVSSVVREGIIAAALTGAIELMRLIMFRPLPGFDLPLIGTVVAPISGGGPFRLLKAGRREWHDCTGRYGKWIVHCMPEFASDFP